MNNCDPVFPAVVAVIASVAFHIKLVLSCDSGQQDGDVYTISGWTTWTHWTPCPFYCHIEDRPLYTALEYRQRTCLEIDELRPTIMGNKPPECNCGTLHNTVIVSRRCSEKSCQILTPYEDRSPVEVEEEGKEVTTPTTTAVSSTTTTEITTSTTLPPTSPETTTEITSTSQQTVSANVTQNFTFGAIGELGETSKESEVLSDPLARTLIALMCISGVCTILFGMLLVRSIMKAFEQVIDEEEEIKQQEIQLTGGNMGQMFNQR